MSACLNQPGAVALARMGWHIHCRVHACTFHFEAIAMSRSSRVADSMSWTRLEHARFSAALWAALVGSVPAAALSQQQPPTFKFVGVRECERCHTMPTEGDR